MKLNEVLDVFGNESLEMIMTPEQEFEASVESIIEEIDNVMEIRSGLEDMEYGAIELAKASCESLLTGLAVREISIANEDLDFGSLCASFGVKPSLFGLEADEATMKEKIKDRASRAGSTIRNSRIAKAAVAIYAKIVAFLKSFFSFDNIVVRMIRKLSDKAKGLFKKGVNQNAEVQGSATEEVLKAHDESMQAVKKGIFSKSYDKVVEVINELVAKIKGIEFKKPFVKAGEFLKDVIKLKPKSTEKVTEDEIKEAVKDVEPTQVNRVLKAFQNLLSTIKDAFKKAVSIDLKSLIKLGGKGEKVEGTTESVEFGIESLDALFGEIKRVESGLEDVEVPEEYAEIGIEAAEMFEELDAFDATIEAVEAVEEMYIEATIPSQIAALESIAIEKGLNPDNGVSFDLFGNMSAGIEASDEVVKNASEETKKTLKERVKEGASKISKSVKSVVTFVVNKFQGFKLIPSSLNKMMTKIEKMDENEFKEFMTQISGDINAMLGAIYAAKNLSDAMRTGYQPEGTSEIKSFTFNAETSKDELMSALKEAYNVGKTMRIPKGNRKDIEFLMYKARNIEEISKFRLFAKKVGSCILAGLKAAKNGLKSLYGKAKSKFGKKKESEEAPVEA